MHGNYVCRYRLVGKGKNGRRNLKYVKYVKERIALTKLRLSNHILMIEKGRHQDIDKNLRFCPFCPRLVEDEQHFVTRCPQYRYIRSDLLRNATTIIPTIHNHCDDIKFVYLMSQTPSLIAKFANKAFELREFLLEKHRPFD